MSGQVREATPMDAEAIARIHVETWQAAYAGLVPDAYLAGKDIRQQAARWRETIGRRKGETVLVVLDEEGEIAGFGSCGRARHGGEGPAFRGEVYSLYVHPDFQERGYGRALLIALIEELAAKGYTDAGLWMLAGNPTRFFYERMGGQAVAGREERFAGVWLPEVAYAWNDVFSWLAQVKHKQKRGE